MGPQVSLEVEETATGKKEVIRSGARLPAKSFFALQSMKVKLVAPAGEYKKQTLFWIIRKLKEEGEGRSREGISCRKTITLE